jgi:DNA-binding transcriptional ArsR family regulator
MQEDSTTEIYRLQAELCKALSDPKRLLIIKELRGGERTVTELMALLGLKQSNTSQHLGKMRRIGVISFRREGNTVFYRLANPRIAEACDLVHQVIAEQLQNSRSLSKAMERLA